MNTVMVEARDGCQLACHCHSPQSNSPQGNSPQGNSPQAPTARLLFLHGGSFNSRRYANFAKACTNAGFEVVLCDWRGHGESQGIPGTCDYIGQMEDDLADIMASFNHDAPLPTLIGGHSAGAVICLRYIEKYGQSKIVGTYLIAPAVSNAMEALRFDQEGSKTGFWLHFWRKKPAFNGTPEAARKYIPRINTRLFWLAFVLPFLRHRTIMSFPGSEKMAKIEGRVLNYSFNLMVSVSIHKYIRAFRQINVPVIFVCGQQDEILHPEFLPTVSQWHLSPELDKQLHMLDKVNHMTVMNAASRILPTWLSQRWGQNPSSKKAAEKAVEKAA